MQKTKTERIAELEEIIIRACDGCEAFAICNPHAAEDLAAIKSTLEQAEIRQQPGKKMKK